MSDGFAKHASGLSSPATELYEITPDDAADLAVVPRALSVATSGTVRMTTVGGTTATVYVVAGCPFPARARRIWATGTSATLIVGLA